MTEIVARLPRPRGSLFALQLCAAAAGLALVGAGVLVLRPDRAAVRHVHSARPSSAPARLRPVRRPVVVDGRVSNALGADAARGLDRGFFTSSPGGILATAARVARWRSLVVRAAQGSGLGPNLLEAMIFVESSGRPNVVAGSLPGAVGLTQLGAAYARHALRLHVDLGRSGGLTRRLERAEWDGHRVRAHQLLMRRQQVDQRFAPLKSLRATVRYLEHARRMLGRADLAVASYHLGLRSLARAVRAYGAKHPSYAALYFGSSPLLHVATWRRLAVGGDYYWKVLAAERLMRLYRNAPSALRWEQRQQARKSSAEEVMHPRSATRRFLTPDAIGRAWRRHYLRAIPRNARVTHIAIGPFFGEEAHALGRSKRLYRGLRPAALEVLLYIGRQVHRLSHARQPLILTSAVRDNRYQRVLMRVNANAARTYSMHTTGYAFDIARAYANRRQAAAFQFVLDRLVAVDAIAYIREYGAIHVAAASDAAAKLALLRRLQ